MSLDPMLIVHKAQMWKRAKFVALPNNQYQPVIWIEGDLVRTYHPVLDDAGKQSIRVPGKWNEIAFRKVVNQLRRSAEPIISERMHKLEMPGGYYASWPDIVSKFQRDDHSFTGEVTQQDREDAKKG